MNISDARTKYVCVVPGAGEQCGDLDGDGRLQPRHQGRKHRYQPDGHQLNSYHVWGGLFT